MSNNNALPPDVRATVDAIRQQYEAIPQHAWDFDRQIKPMQSDIDALLELVDKQFAIIDRLLNDHEPRIAALETLLAERATLPAPTAAGAAEPGNGVCGTCHGSGMTLVVCPTCGGSGATPLDEPDMKWWHLPEFGAFMAVDTEDQRDKSFGPFATREEAKTNWLALTNATPPGESEGTP